ncbi:type II secretion system protein GspM [Coralloluteibacterium thermophilus]|uniref:Type II secretion system protein GspM n=1 Tax=Coralloluteibacterium thermophilum TaxID=2707049 RepID=A0ABV9NME0_9GAMM
MPRLRLERSPVRERWLAVGLLLAVLALAYLVLVHWWWTAPLLALDRDVQDLRAQEQRMRMIAGQRPAIEAALAEVRETEQGDPGFLPEASAQLAAAGLIQRLDGVVRSAAPSGCEVTNRTPAPAAQRGGERYARVVLQVRLACGIDGFAAVLAELESGRPQLFVDNLNVQARRTLRNARSAAPAQPGALDITFDLYGFLRRQAEPGDAD